MPELVLIQIFPNKYKTKRLKRHCITLMTHICNYKLKNNSKTKWGVTHHLKQNSCGVCEKVFVYLCFLSLSLQSAQVKLLLPSGKSTAPFEALLERYACSLKYSFTHMVVAGVCGRSFRKEKNRCGLLSLLATSLFRPIYISNWLLLRKWPITLTDIFFKHCPGLSKDFQEVV